LVAIVLVALIVAIAVDRIHDEADAEDAADHAGRGDRDARGRLTARSPRRHRPDGYPEHGWVVASFIVVGVMSVLALGLLEPANIAVLVELKKPRPNPHVIERLMKRFIYCAGILGAMQVATLVIMTKLASS
jgi:hypothetical protein